MHDFEVFKRSFVSKLASAVCRNSFAMLGTFHDQNGSLRNAFLLAVLIDLPDHQASACPSLSKAVQLRIRVQIQLNSLLTANLDGSESLASRFCRFILIVSDTCEMNMLNFGKHQELILNLTSLLAQKAALREGMNTFLRLYFHKFSRPTDKLVNFLRKIVYVFFIKCFISKTVTVQVRGKLVFMLN